VVNLLDQVERNIGLRRLLHDRQAVLVAVSGGLDSMVLLHALHQLARSHEWRLSLAHFNHKLRGRSSEVDEKLVRRVAGQLGLPIEVESAPVRDYAEVRGLSIEMAARELRHNFLARLAKRLAIHTVALAHHADDQVELFFLRLFRGSGGEGLSGMKWRGPSPDSARVELIRPFLDLPKAALREYAAQHNLSFREDASNARLDIQRNRVRNELVPFLERNYQPALRRTILRVMEILREEADFARQAAREWNGRFAPEKPERRRKARATAFRLETDAFEELPIAVQRRAIHLQLLGQGVKGDFETVELLRLELGRSVSVARAAEGGASALAVCGPDGRVRLDPGVSVQFTGERRSFNLEPAAGGTDFAGVKVWWKLSRKAPKKAFGRGQYEVFDADKLGKKVILRFWQAGDRFQPIGMPGEVKLQDLFVNHKIPRLQRHRLLVATTGSGELFWIEGLRISERFKLTSQTKLCLHWRWKRL